ncbi:MAG: phenylalanine--tRNA ligase beta subunit-related protein [Patescibacteria group bacterium]
MKVLYSQIKELVPGLKAEAKEVGEVLTQIGFMMDSFSKARYQGKEDYVLGLEIRENRGDLLGIIGIAREVAAYWGLKCKMPKASVKLSGEQNDKIKVLAKKYVKRAMAIEIEGFKNQHSPAWLKEYLKFYDINSINLAVDLSNYVMILTGYPSHLLDRDKMQGGLVWDLNDRFRKFTSLFGTEAELNRKQEIIIRDEKNILGMAGILGGQRAAIEEKSENIIAEIAIYDHATVRKNARDLRLITEAGIRLGRDLDPEGLEQAFRLLVSLLIEHGQGNPVNGVFSYYPQKRKTSWIELSLDEPGIYAGIKIGAKKVTAILENLRFRVRRKRKAIEVRPPLDRTDVELKEDVIEEVIRMTGYENIPWDQTPALKVTKNITPKVISLAEKAREILMVLGYDEVMSLPMVSPGANERVNYRDFSEVGTQNSVNEEYPNLRQSMAVGLKRQAEEFLKKNIETIRIFEIGKVFGEKKGKYLEFDALGMLWAGKSINALKRDLESLNGLLGMPGLEFEKAKKIPASANPYACWDIRLKGERIGIIYKLKEKKLEASFLEIDLSFLAKQMGKKRATPVVELKRKIVTLDANVELEGGRKKINDFLKKAAKKVGAGNLWSLEVVDVYPLKNKQATRWTVRVSYKGISDPEAKKRHEEVFGLGKEK